MFPTNLTNFFVSRDNQDKKIWKWISNSLTIHSTMNHYMYIFIVPVHSYWVPSYRTKNFITRERIIFVSTVKHDKEGTKGKSFFCVSYQWFPLMTHSGFWIYPDSLSLSSVTCPAIFCGKFVFFLIYRSNFKWALLYKLKQLLFWIRLLLL